MNKEINETNNQSLKTQLSLASLMFFSPFIKYLLKSGDFELSNYDKNFVGGYMSLGFINLILFGIAIASGLISYFYDISLFNIIYQVLVLVLVTLLIIGCILAITGIDIANTKSNKIIVSNKLDKIFSYLPGYSIYLWYNKHDFNNPDIILKESMLMRILFGISCFFANPFISSIIGIIILTRIISLIADINMVPKYLSDFVSNLFYKNPEEIWAYIRGSLLFIFHRHYNLPYWKLLIEDIKKEYQYLYDIKKFNSIKAQYGLLLAGIAAILRQINLGNISGLAVLTIIIVLARYGVMIYFWGRSPALPLMRELVNMFTKPFTYKK